MDTNNNISKTNLDEQNTSENLSPSENAEQKELKNESVAIEKEKEAKQAENSSPITEQPTTSYSLDEDYVALCKINLFQAILLKFQNGKHPSKEIDALLDRRIKLHRKDFQGPLILRIFSSIIMIFLSGSFAWVCLWLIARYLGEKAFIIELSGAMATMIFAVIGIALFQPVQLIEEQKLKKAVSEQMTIIKHELTNLQDTNNTSKDAESQIND